MPDDDPDVFHMAGCNLIDKLKQKFYDSTEEFDQETLTVIYQDVLEAEEYIDNSICLGSPDYG